MDCHKNYIMVYINGSYESLTMGNEYEIILDGGLSFRGTLILFQLVGESGEEIVIQVCDICYHFDIEQIIYIGEVQHDNRN